MRLLVKLSVFLVITSLWTSSFAYTRSAYEKYLESGVWHALKGRFAEARLAFLKSRKAHKYYIKGISVLPLYHKVLDDVTSRRIKRKTAMALFAGFYNSQRAKFHRAIKNINTAIRLNPRYSTSYSNRAVAYINLGKYRQAIRDYSQAIRVNPRDTRAYNGRGYVYGIKLKRRKKACADWKIACKLGQCGNYTPAKKERYCR